MPHCRQRSHCCVLGIGDTGSAIGNIVGDRHGARYLHDRRKAIGIVVRVVHGPVRGHFLGESIKPIIGARDRRRHDVTRVFLLHLRDPIARVVGVVRAGAIMERRLGPAIQRIIGIGRRLALSVEHGGQVAVVIVRVGLGPEQRIFSRRRSIHIVGCVHRLLALRIGDGEEVAIGVIGNGMGEGIGNYKKCVESDYGCHCPGNKPVPCILHFQRDTTTCTYP
jgi:hypothetical protein